MGRSRPDAIVVVEENSGKRAVGQDSCHPGEGCIVDDNEFDSG